MVMALNIVLCMTEMKWLGSMCCHGPTGCARLAEMQPLLKQMTVGRALKRIISAVRPMKDPIILLGWGQCVRIVTAEPIMAGIAMRFAES